MAFTPVESSLGGLLIGSAASLAYMADGKITGISGILGPALRSLGTGQLREAWWKWLFLLGLVLAGLANLLLNGSFAFPDAMPFSVLRYLLGGLCIGLGTRLGRGCTSGHGICGLPRLSQRSWIAVPCFMIVAAITVAVSRHAVHRQGSGGIANLEWPSRWEFPVGTIVVAAVLIVPTVCLPYRVRSYVSPTASGFIFGLGLGCSGMTRQDKVLNFLDVAGTWDPSLMLVMGCGLCASAPSFLYAEKEDRKPLCGAHTDCAFEKPAKRGDYGSLVFGSCAFGLGWGLTGICPGPGVVGVMPYLSQGGSGLAFGLAFLAICASWLGTDWVLAVWKQRQSTRYAAEATE